jgi:hypothetical protein
MRTAAAIVDTAGLALLAAACGGSKVGHVAARQNAAIAFSRCMRSHGVSNWPDLERVPSTAPPEGSPYQFDLQGGLNGRSFSPQITSAMHECLHREHLADVAWT